MAGRAIVISGRFVINVRKNLYKLAANSVID
jgi:hypothetical protein